MQSEAILTGWDVHHDAGTDWVPWGADGKARGKILGQADGYSVTVIEADAGYTGSYHEHGHAEFFYLVEGRIRNQGQVLDSGDAYAAAAGSVHSDFEVLAPSRYVIVWRL